MSFRGASVGAHEQLFVTWWPKLSWCCAEYHTAQSSSRGRRAWWQKGESKPGVSLGRIVLFDYINRLSFTNANGI